MKEEEKYMRFQSYLDETLEAQERAVFERELAADEALANEFNNFKETTTLLSQRYGHWKEREALESNLNEVSDAFFGETPTTETKVIHLKAWHYAAAASVLLLFGMIFFGMDGNPDYHDFASHDAISLTVRGSQADIFSKAEDAFNNKNYGKAGEYFDSLLAADPSNAEIRLYKAITLIETNYYREADRMLLRLSQENTAYKYQAEWYWALSKLKQEDYDACKTILKKIPESVQEYWQAQKLLQEL